MNVSLHAFGKMYNTISPYISWQTRTDVQAEAEKQSKA